MRCGSWNVRSFSRFRCVEKVVAKLGNQKLDLVGIQEIRWNKGVTESEKCYRLFCGNCNENHQL
jgi:exonuclease III